MTANSRRSRYRFHRLSLSPLIAQNPTEELTAVSNQIQPSEQKPFLEFILQNGLGPLWFDLLKRHHIQSYMSPRFTRELRNITSHTAELYLFQKITVDKIQTLLSRQGIDYALFKGAHTRELLYDNPALRYACDIDILVARADKLNSIQTLVQAGFIFQPKPENISHEATLTNNNVSIDLHWDILRPGRTRIDLTEEYLQTRKEYEDYWALDNEATLFIMLVHPMFTKYTTAPQASLLHLLDLHTWLTKEKTDWNKLYDYLERGGVKTAAWITATWLTMLTGESLPQPFLQKIKPGSIKARYLKIWLNQNLSTRLLNQPLLIQTGFTLPAHDTAADSCRFLKQVSHDKKNAESETEYLMKQISK